MEGPRCVIRNCYEVKYISRHRFPNPAKDLIRFEKWLRFCETELFTFPPEYVYKNRRVCGNHFTKDQFGPNGVLLRTAYPVLNIPCKYISEFAKEIEVHRSLF